MPEDDLQASIDYARSRIDKAQQPWSVVTGPAAALVCTLDRLQWRVVSAVLLITDEGREVDLRVTPPHCGQENGGGGGEEVAMEECR